MNSILHWLLTSLRPHFHWFIHYYFPWLRCKNFILFIPRYFQVWKPRQRSRWGVCDFVCCRIPRLSWLSFRNAKGLRGRFKCKWFMHVSLLNFHAHTLHWSLRTSNMNSHLSIYVLLFCWVYSVMIYLFSNEKGLLSLKNGFKNINSCIVTLHT